MPDVYASLKAFLSKGTFNLHKIEEQNNLSFVGCTSGSYSSSLAPARPCVGLAWKCGSFSREITSARGTGCQIRWLAP